MRRVMMKHNCAFTICAKNYLGLAQVLESSVKKYNPELDFFIFIADVFDAALDENHPYNLIISKYALNIEEEIWLNMAFKYNVTEFCTAIKPYCIEYLFKIKGYQKIVYLDPDVYLFSDLKGIFDNLDDYLFITAPHIIVPEIEYSGEYNENNFLKVGINNLGFLGFRNSEKSRHIIEWWQKRLIGQCFGEQLYGTSTDQKWMDFLSAFLNNDEFLCSKNMGLNVAPWNYFERKIISEDGQYYVVSRSNSVRAKDRLIFVHFAGYNYAEFAQKKVNNISRIRINNLMHYDDINELIAQYVNKIFENRDLFIKYLNLNYSYNYYSNNVEIDSLHRRLYNGLYNEFNFRKNPFNASENSYYALLRKKGLIRKKRTIKIDSLTPDNIAGYHNKLRIVYILMRAIYKIIGYSNYVLCLQLIRRLSIYDINTFLLGRKYENKKLR
jgi:hypothetical protein